MRKSIILLLSFICVITLVAGCSLFAPEPILLDESFENGTIDSKLGYYSPGVSFVPKIVQDGENSVLQLSSSTDSLLDLGLSDEDHPMYSGVAFGGGPNQRTIKTDWDYELKYLMKVVSQEPGKGMLNLTFRYFGPSFDNRSSFSLFRGLDFHLYSV